MEYCTEGRINRLDLHIATWKDFKSTILSNKYNEQNTVYESIVRS